eukprot:5051846-Pyramimonas_sp.AAC.1
MSTALNMQQTLWAVLESWHRCNFLCCDSVHSLHDYSRWSHPSCARRFYVWQHCERHVIRAT